MIPGNRPWWGGRCPFPRTSLTTTTYDRHTSWTDVRSESGRRENKHVETNQPTNQPNQGRQAGGRSVVPPTLKY